MIDDDSLFWLRKNLHNEGMNEWAALQFFKQIVNIANINLQKARHANWSAAQCDDDDDLHWTLILRLQFVVDHSFCATTGQGRKEGRKEGRAWKQHHHHVLHITGSQGFDLHRHVSDLVEISFNIDLYYYCYC